MKLSKICLNITDGTHSSITDDVNGDYYLLSCKNIKNGKIIISNNERKINFETFLTLNKRTKLSQNDILITTVGTIGEIAIINSKDVNYDFQRSVGILKVNTEIMLPKYVYYYLQSNTAQQKINSLVKGAVQKCLFLKDIGNIEIIYKSTLEQHHIVDTIGSIDDLIEKVSVDNNKILKMANDIFHKYNKSTRNKKKLIDISKDIVCGKTPSTKRLEYWGENVPFITIPDMHDSVYVTKCERMLSPFGAASQKNKTLPKNSICVSCIATPGLVSLTSQESQTNQQINAIICKEKISPYYVYLAMSQPEIKEMIIQLGSGGSTTYNLNKNDFSKIEIDMLNEKDMVDFNDEVSALFDLMLLNNSKIQKLTSLKEIYLKKFFGQ